MSTCLGSDIGGTFTDFGWFDDATGELRIHKCLTTPNDPSQAVIDGLGTLVGSGTDAGTDAGTGDGHRGELASHIHGTTLVINAVIERKGAVTGLITTRGCRDVLSIGREKRYDGYDLGIVFPEPLVERPLRLEVDERLHASGAVLEALDDASVRSAVRVLLEHDVESVAVCLLHSYRNPEHERQVRDIVREMAPELPVSLSCEVLPEMKEYERTSTTVINAYTLPAIEEYLSRLDGRLSDAGKPSDLLLMQSSGGITTAATAREFPVQIIESGPAAGALGAAHFARLAGLRQVLAFDMGGTTAKLCLVTDGQVNKATHFEVAHVYRFKAGSGLPVHAPVVDLMEIGAGGGSIARVTDVGTLQVGPQSAGADPGPACYGLGGRLPSVSDADLVLGFLDPEHFLGGDMKLDLDAARLAIDEMLARPLGLSIEHAAWGVHGIVNENMAAAAKVYVTERGEDPARHTLVAFGGAGPVHAVDLARRLGIGRVLIPPHAGVASALGMIVAPVSSDTVRTHPCGLDEMTPVTLCRLFAEMAAECRSRMPENTDDRSLRELRSLDMCYVGQGFQVNVSLPDDIFEAKPPASILDALVDAFNATYTRLYGRVYDDLALQIVNLRMSVQADGRAIDLRGAAQGVAPDAVGDVIGAPTSHRLAYCPVIGDFVAHAVYRRTQLPSGFEATGPLIVEENESTTVVGSDGELCVDPHGSLIVSIGS